MPKSTHHIIPRSLFKYRKTEKQDDSDRNTVALTHMEHIKAHILLLKYYESTKRTDEEVQVMRMKMANALYATMNFQTTLWSLLDKDILTEGDREYLRTVLYKCRKEYGIGTKVKCYHKTTGKKILMDKSEGIPEGYVEDYREVDYRKYYVGDLCGQMMKHTRNEWCQILHISVKQFDYQVKKHGTLQKFIDDVVKYYEKRHIQNLNEYLSPMKIIELLGIRMCKGQWRKCLNVDKKSFRVYKKNHNLSDAQTIEFYIKKKNISIDFIKEFYKSIKDKHKD